MSSHLKIYFLNYATWKGIGSQINTDAKIVFYLSWVYVKLKQINKNVGTQAVFQ